MDRHKALERVAKLCKVTVENGATGQEESAAGARVDALVARYKLTTDEVRGAIMAVIQAERPTHVRPRPQPTSYAQTPIQCMFYVDGVMVATPDFAFGAAPGGVRMRVVNFW